MVLTFLTFGCGVGKNETVSPKFQFPMKSSDIKKETEFPKQLAVCIGEEGYTDAEVHNCDGIAL